MIYVALASPTDIKHMYPYAWQRVGAHPFMLAACHPVSSLERLDAEKIVRDSQKCQVKPLTYAGCWIYILFTLNPVSDRPHIAQPLEVPSFHSR